jgi:hypothetical protein
MSSHCKGATITVFVLAMPSQKTLQMFGATDIINMQTCPRDWRFRLLLTTLRHVYTGYPNNNGRAAHRRFLRLHVSRLIPLGDSKFSSLLRLSGAVNIQALLYFRAYTSDPIEFKLLVSCCIHLRDL